MIFHVGPFTLYRCENNDHLDIYLTVFGDASWGWEYGPQDEIGDGALVWVRMLGLNVLRIEFWRRGFDIRVLGFWWIV